MWKEVWAVDPNQPIVKVETMVHTHAALVDFLRQ
jgi:hypothetical protein